MGQFSVTQEIITGYFNFGIDFFLKNDILNG